MDACLAVEREVDNVLSKFGDIKQNFNQVLQQLIDDIETVKNDLHTKNTNDGIYIGSLVVICIEHDIAFS